MAAGMAAALAGCLCLGAAPASAAPLVQAIGASRPIAGPTGAGVSRAVPATGADPVAFQNRLDSALQKMLDAVVGPGRAVVTTAVELDLDRVETVTVTYAKDPAVGALSERLSRRWYADAGGGTRYESTSVVRANAVDSLHETRRTAPGAVRKLSVAVLVDTAAGADLAQLKALVSVAAGIQPGRGDVVAVAAMPLRAGTAGTTEATVAGPSAASVPDRRPTVIAVGAGVLALLLLVAGWRHRRQALRRDDRRAMRAVPAGEPPIVAVAEPFAGPARQEVAGRRRTIGQFAGDDPQQAAAVLRGWTGTGR